MGVITKQTVFMTVVLIALTYPVVFVHYLEIDFKPWLEAPKFSWPKDYEINSELQKVKLIEQGIIYVIK